MQARQVLVLAAATMAAALAAASLAAASLAAPAAGPETAAARIAQVGAAVQGVPACASCHGQQGQGVSAQNGPRLAHLDPGYLDRQLEGFAAGERRSPVMGPIAKALTAAQRASLSAYFASLPAAYEAGPADATGPARGQELALTGDWSLKAPACASCHGPRGQGVGSLTPPLTGQSESYLVRQLTAFRDGDRTGPLGLMAGIAKRLSRSDLRAAAAYYASQPPPRSAPARPEARP